MCYMDRAVALSILGRKGTITKSITIYVLISCFLHPGAGGKNSIFFSSNILFPTPTLNPKGIDITGENDKSKD